MDVKISRGQIYTNLYNFVWFRLSRYYNKCFISHEVNSTVYSLYEQQRMWNGDMRRELRSIAFDMYDNQGFADFQRVASELENPIIEHNRILIILYIAVQYGKLYIDRGESFAVKHIIYELQKSLGVSLVSSIMNEGNLSTFI